MAFISAALRCDRTYNLGALVAFRLSANREKGGICGGLIASRLLAMHGVGPHHLDIQFPIERLDINSMISHKFVSNWATLNNLVYEITFFQKRRWRLIKSERLVCLPAPLLFNLDARERWSLSEDDLEAYLEEHGPRPEDDGEEPDGGFTQPSDIAGFPYQHFDYGTSAPSSSREPDYDHARDDSPGWSVHPRR